jgi:hypothetical protein
MRRGGFGVLRVPSLGGQVRYQVRMGTYRFRPVQVGSGCLVHFLPLESFDLAVQDGVEKAKRKGVLGQLTGWEGGSVDKDKKPNESDPTRRPWPANRQVRCGMVIRGTTDEPVMSTELESPSGPPRSDGKEGTRWPVAEGAK